MQAIMDENVARLYMVGQVGETVELNIPGTKYRLALKAAGAVAASPQGRLRGVVRLPVWKMDVVTAGGAYVEPLVGKPRRVQGQVIATCSQSNSVTVEVCGQPIVGVLPARWNAADVVVGTRVGLDIPSGGVFEPLSRAQQSEFGTEKSETVNLRVD